MGVNLVEIQRLSLLNLSPNKPPDRAKATKPVNSRREPTAAEQSSQSEEGSRMPGEVLISVSSTVADSNGIDLSGNHLSFAVDDDTGSTVINIINNENGEVLKQIPSEDLLRLRKRMGEVQGLILDRRA